LRHALRKLTRLRQFLSEQFDAQKAGVERLSRRRVVYSDALIFMKGQARRRLS
jgi:hypothetical protein